MPKRNKGIHIRYRRDRQCWDVGEYVGGSFKRYATGLGCTTVAEEKLAEIIAQRSKPKKQRDDITLGEIIAYYINEHVPTLGSPNSALKCFDRLLPFWGDLKLDDLRKSTCRDYLEYRKKEFIRWQQNGPYKTTRQLSDETVRRELEQLQAAIRYAWQDNLISFYPAVWKPKKCQPKDRWLTQREAAKLLRAARSLPDAGEYLERFILIGLYTGARSSAILNLRWSDIDFNTGFINFKNQGEARNKRKPRLPMPKRLLRELRKSKGRGVETGYVIFRNKVIVSPEGKQIIQAPIKSVKNSFGTACRIAGLNDVTPHTLKHTAASWMVQKGVPLFEVAKYLETTMQVIERTYGHLEPEHLQVAKESYG